MIQYHVSRNGTAVGVYRYEELLPLLQQGQLLPTDLCWHEGLSDWKTMIEVVPPPSPYGAPFAHMPPPQRTEDSSGMRMLLPIGRSGWAIAAGYLGLFSLAIVPAPLALICALLAIRDIKASRLTPTPKYGMGRAVFGLIMGIIGTVLLAIWGVAALKVRH